MQTIAAIIRKEFLQIRRDPMMLRIIFAIPLIQLFVLGYAITFDVKNVSLVVLDNDHTRVSRLIVDKVRASGRFEFVGAESAQQRLKGWLERGEAILALSIPESFQEDLLSGRVPALQIQVDGVDSNTSLVALGYLQRIIGATVGELAGQRDFLFAGASGGGTGEIESEVRVWFNPELESMNYTLPGIVVLLVTITTTLLTSMGVVRERQIGTLEQLNVTPIRPWQLIIGKIVPFGILGYILLGIALIVVAVWYRIPMEGSLVLLLALAFVFLLSTLGAGLFISTLAGTQQEAVLIAFFFIVFAILMSGLFAPIHNMPYVVQKLTYLNPVRYFMSIVRGIYLKGSGMEYLWRDSLCLTLWGLSALGLASLRFNKQVD